MIAQRLSLPLLALLLAAPALATPALAAPAMTQEGWVIQQEGEETRLSFGGKDGPNELGYFSHGFACRPGGAGGRIVINEGMPQRLKGAVRMKLQTLGGAFDIAGEMQPNEEAGSPGFEADLTAAQLAAAVRSPGQVILVAGVSRIRMGLRGAEPLRGRFLEACGIR